MGETDTLLGGGGARRFFAPIASATREIIMLAYVDRRGVLLASRIHPGERNRIALPLREIVVDALACDATGVVMAHNHPSGDPCPSRADLAYTATLATTLASLDLRLLDHLILAGGRSTSLRETGLL